MRAWPWHTPPRSFHSVHVFKRLSVAHPMWLFSMLTVSIVGPLIIEPLQAEKRVSTGAIGALDDLLVVQTKI